MKLAYDETRPMLWCPICRIYAVNPRHHTTERHARAAALKGTR